MGAMFAKSGIGSFGRLAEILTLIGIINYFTSFIPAFPSMIHIEYIIPVFNLPFSGFVRGVVFLLGAASEYLLLLLIIVADIPDPLKHYKWVVSGIIFSSIIFSVAILIIIAMLSPEMAKRIAFGGINAARIIQTGDFLSGLELFVLGTYQFIAIGKATMCIYCAWTAAKQIFGEKREGLQIILISLLMLIPAVWINSYSKAYYIAVLLGSYVILPFCIIVLLLASIGIRIKRKRAGGSKTG